MVTKLHIPTPLNGKLGQIINDVTMIYDGKDYTSYALHNNDLLEYLYYYLYEFGKIPCIVECHICSDLFEVTPKILNKYKLGISRMGDGTTHLMYRPLYGTPRSNDHACYSKYLREAYDAYVTDNLIEGL